jgi:hypothetical protein
MATKTHQTHVTLMELGSLARTAFHALEGCLDALVAEHSVALLAAERAARSRSRLREVRALYVGPGSRNE